MATRTYINRDLSALKQVLESIGFFDSVEYDDAQSPTKIVLKDADNNTLAEMTLNGITVYVSASESKAVTFSGTRTQAIVAYWCGNGALITYEEDATNPYHAYVMISKTNDDKVAFVFSGTVENPRSKALCTLYCIAWGDDAPIAKYENLAATAHRQTVLMPFPTNSPASHTVSAFFTAYGNYFTNEYLEFTLNDEPYFTNGYWVLKDSD